MFAIGEWIFAGGVGRPQAAVTHDNCFTWNASVRVIIELIRMSVPKDYNVFIPNVWLNLGVYNQEPLCSVLRVSIS